MHTLAEEIEEECAGTTMTINRRRHRYGASSAICLRDLALPAVAVREQALLVVVELLARLGGEFEVRALDDGVDRAGLLAQPAIDAFHHVDVVARGAPGAVVPARAGLDGDRLRRADRLAELAGDAALLAVRIAAQRMLAAEARRDRPLLERIVERRLRLEEIAHGEEERRDELPQEYRAGRPIESHWRAPSMTGRIAPSSPKPSCRSSIRPPRTRTGRRSARCAAPATA